MLRTNCKRAYRWTLGFVAAVLVAGLMVGCQSNPTNTGDNAASADARPANTAGDAYVSYPSGDAAEPAKTRSGPSGSKLTPELLALYEQFVAQPDGAEPTYSDDQLRNLFGIDPDEANPDIYLLVTLAEGKQAADLEKAGASIFGQDAGRVSLAIPVRRLQRLGLDPAVAGVEVFFRSDEPKLPIPDTTFTSFTKTRALPSLNLHGSGKGVIVGVIDSGIDFRHPDFRNEDGTTRIALLYDMYDQSYEKSGGQVGSRPPFANRGKPIGTLYTRDQINAALQDRGKVNSVDRNGHGTLVAGTAAGNGRASNGRYKGYATDSELVIVNAMQPRGGFAGIMTASAARWITQIAQRAGKPVVVNMSLGGHASNHTGDSAQERVLNSICGSGKPGVAIVVSAGNEGEMSFHASGRFGPRRPGQLDVDGTKVDLYVDQRSLLDAYFSRADHWGLGIVGINGGLTDANGKPQKLLVFNTGQGITVSSSPNLPKAQREAFMRQRLSLSPQPNNEQLVRLNLDPGRYVVWGFGASDQVRKGTFSLYLPQLQTASFGRGTTKRNMVGSPGNAGNVITVGSYDFRRDWRAADGKLIGYNMVLGEISSYSSPGFRRDGVIKPDIVAPGQWTIAPFAEGSAIAKSLPNHVVHGGEYMAWNGTSAAAPYASGIIAIMLEKNPDLDAAQIKRILHETAIEDRFTGAVPNPRWGHGKINRVMAIRRAVQAKQSQP